MRESGSGNLISELSEDRLVLLSTHIVSDVEYVANEIILMKEGKFFYTGTSDEIILSMDMFVWNCIIPKSELNNYMKKYLIGNVRTVSDGVELRVLFKDATDRKCVQVEATLEDAFFCILEKRQVIKTMFKYELKKIFSKRMRWFCLRQYLCMRLYYSGMAIGSMSYTDADGQSHTGIDGDGFWLKMSINGKGNLQRRKFPK